MSDITAIREAFGVYYVAPDETLSPSPADDFWYERIAGRTASGVRVDEGTALNYSVCWAATRLLAGTTGWLPFNLYKRMSGGGANIDSKHPVHRLIHSKPNNDMVSMMFRARGVNHQVNWGNCYAEIVRNRGGFIESLEPIHPCRIPMQNIKRDDRGRLVYLVNPSSGAGRPVPVKQADMFHVPNTISEDGIIGKGVVSHAREAIGKAMGTQRRGAAAINNGGAPPLALKGGKFRDKADRDDYRKQMNEVHSGADNAGKWLLLPTDSEVQMLGFSLEDSQFIESEQFDIEEIARWYNVPPHLVGHLLRATFNNIEELGISFVTYSLIQLLKLWEQEVWNKLLTTSEQETHYAKFVVDALERGNMATRTEAGVKKFFNGLWNLNQWSEQEDMNPITETVTIDGKEVNLGEMRFVQQAMIPLSHAAKGPPEPAAPKEPEKKEPDEKKHESDLSAAKLAEMLAASQDATAKMILEMRVEMAERKPSHRRDPAVKKMKKSNEQLAKTLLRDTMQRLISIEVNALKKSTKPVKNFESRVTEFYEKHAVTMESELRQPMSAVWLANPQDGSHLTAAKALALKHIDESKAQLASIISTCKTPEELTERVEERISSWHSDRVEPAIPNSMADELWLMKRELQSQQAATVQPAPVVNVTVDTAALAKALVAQMPPAVVNVSVPPAPEYDIEPERDPVSGLTTRFRRVPKC